MECNNCEANITAASAFCPNCGTPATAPQVASVPAVKVINRSVIIAAIAVGVVAVGGATGWLLLNGDAETATMTATALLDEDGGDSAQGFVTKGEAGLEDAEPATTSFAVTESSLLEVSIPTTTTTAPATTTTTVPATTTTTVPATTTPETSVAIVVPESPSKVVDCDGSWLTAVASAPLVNVEVELASNPGSKVLKADESCMSLNPAFSRGAHAGQSIYIIFYGPFDTRSAAQEQCLSLGKFTNEDCFVAPLTNDPADRSVRFGPSD